MVDTFIRESPSGKLVATGSGGSSGSLTSLRWVDPATSIDPVDQDGSEGAPFETIQQAIDSLSDASVTAGTVICTDGDYLGAGAEWTPDAGDTLTLVGYGQARNVGEIAILSLGAALVLEQLGTPADTTPLSVANATATVLRVFDSYVGGLIETAALLDADNSTFAGAVDAGAIQSNDSVFDGAITSGDAFFQSGEINVSVLSSDTARFYDVAFLGESDPVTIDAANILINGSLLAGNVTGLAEILIDTVSYNQAIQNGFTISAPSVVVSGGAGGDPPVSLRWVDPATTVDPSSQTGSESAPFSTIQDAVDSLTDEGITEGTIVCVDGSYGGLPITYADSNFEFVGFGGASSIGSFTATGDSANCTIDNLPFIGGAISMPAATATASLTVRRSTLQDTVSVPAGGIISQNATFQAAVSADDLDALDTAITAALTVTGTLEAAGCSFTTGPIIAAAVKFTNSEALDTVDVTCTTGVFQGCTWPGSLDATDSLQMLDTYMYVGGGGPSNVTVANTLEARNVRFAGDVLIGQLTLDTVTWQSALAGGVTFTFSDVPTRQILDTPLSATVSIVVPAVAADAVGYVTTSLVGTALEGVFVGANEPVIVNPQTDLVAAGAGGGFINARIAGANSLRCAFNGALAGGAANFTVTRGR